MYCVEQGMGLFMKYANYHIQKEKKFKKQLYKHQNMKRIGNTFISDDGLEYVYSHDNINRYSKQLSINRIFVLKDNLLDKPIELNAPKSIGYNHILTEMQSVAFENLESEEGIELSVQISIQVEGAFGDIKNNMDYRRIMRRGFKNVENEISLVFLGYNLRKVHNKKLRLKN